MITIQSLSRVRCSTYVKFLCKHVGAANNHAIFSAVPKSSTYLRQLTSLLPPTKKIHTQQEHSHRTQQSNVRRGIFTTARNPNKKDASIPILENDIEYDPIFELASSTLRFGPSSTSEVGHDLSYLNARRILLFVDPHIANLPPFSNVVSSIEKHAPKGYQLDIYNQIRVEPNNQSFQHAISYMANKTSQNGPYDAIIALGGGSTIDTAKAANLYTCHPPKDFYDYVNPPLGRGLPVPGPLTPLIAIPTTAGTGSETTGVAIFDDVPTKSKTGIAHRRLKPTLGIVDPDNMKSLPSPVALYSGIDVLCHAMESYTAIPYSLRLSGRPSSPVLRPAYQGSNPISDIWSLHALHECAEHLTRMVHDPCDDEEARSKMCLAASSAGMGFGNAGVHLCHGMSYAVSSQVKGGYWVDGYPRLDWRGNVNDCKRMGKIRADNTNEGSKEKHGLVPHGLSVVINAPSVFRFTGALLKGSDSCPIENYSRDRHVKCAMILSHARMKRRDSVADTITEKAMNDQPGEALAHELLELMHDLSIPIGLRSLGYDASDVDDLAQGTLPSHRVTKLSPRQPVEFDELKLLFLDALDG